MTTLQPRPPYTDAELAQLYPRQLHLQQVQILLRHGERTPINARFGNAGLPAFWPYCSAVRRLRAAVLGPSGPGAESVSAADGTFSEIQWRRRLETFDSNDAAIPASGPKGELDSLCDLGMLTDRGRETTYALGTRLRKLYVDHLGFLPASIKDADFIYLRTTPIPRALESMQQAFFGLYPPHTRAPDFPPLTIVSRNPADETLFPNDSNCRRFAFLSRAFAQRAADRWNDTEEMAYVNKKLAKWMPADSPRIAVDSRPRLIGIMDTVSSTMAHGPATRLPKEFYDPKARSIMETIAVEEWFAGYKESQEYRALGIGSLMGDVVARMVSTAERNVPPPDAEFVQTPGQHGAASSTIDGLRSKNKSDDDGFRFGLSGCHDTTLAGILASLGAFGNDAWPPFTSHIAIELFRSNFDNDNTNTTNKPSTSILSSLWPSSKPAPIGRKPTPSLTPREKESLNGYFVRLRYNDTPVVIPGCKTPGNHLDGDESFCTLAAFKSIVDKFTPRDWKGQCHTNVKAPAFPEKEEPAGY
ncbi:histidine phosphatase superfamily [Trichoderma sp. SZMC 28011]